MVSPLTEIHNRDVGQIVKDLIEPTLDAGGGFADVLVLLESVAVGVMLFALKTHSCSILMQL